MRAEQDGRQWRTLRSMLNGGRKYRLDELNFVCKEKMKIYQIIKIQKMIEILLL